MQSGPLKISRMKRSATLVNSFQPLTNVENLSILDVCGGPGCASDIISLESIKLKILLALS